MRVADRCTGRLRIGIDLGGTKIEGVALAGDGAIRARERVPTPREDYAGTLMAIAGLVTRLETAAGGTGSVGVGMPGSIVPRTHRVQNANSTWLNGRTLGPDLEAALGRSVRLANDANCFAVSEARDGAGAGDRTVLGVILGTGCGSGIVVDGRLLDGPRGIGGEWGHNPLPWAEASEHPGPNCWCGLHGCMEAWVSGPALAADHLRATGRAETAETIAVAAQAGDPAAAATLARHASRLARGLAHVVNLVDPDVIVLGGGLSRMAHLYVDLPRLMLRYIFADDAAPAVKILPPRWGDASGVRGAAWLWEA